MGRSAKKRSRAVVASWLVTVLGLGCLAGCARMGADPVTSVSHPDWAMKKSQRLAANELWKAHDGAAGMYIERGCVSETMTDLSHRDRPWVIRCSVFELRTSEGARLLYDYYHDGVEKEVQGIEPLGEATYLWRSPDLSAWIVGFWKGKYFVEASLAEKGAPGGQPDDSSKQALLDFARRLAAKL